MSARTRTRSSGSKRARDGRSVGRRAITSAKNGKDGGRPPAKLPKQLLADIGTPPDDVLKKNAWWSQLIEVLMLGVAKGEPWKSMLEIAIRSAAVATKQYEGEIKALVAELLQREANEASQEASPPMVEAGKDPIAAAKRSARRRDPS